MFGRFGNTTHTDRVRKFDSIDAIEAYWQALNDLEPIPYRNSVDPRGLETALPFTFVLDCMTDRLARIRIAGSKLNELQGIDLRGMPLSSLFVAASRDRLGVLIYDVTHMPSVVKASLSWENDKKTTPAAQMILLPLKDENGQITKLLGGLEFADTRRVGQRFSILGSVSRPVTSREPVAFPKGPELVVSNESDPIKNTARSKPVLTVVQ